MSWIKTGSTTVSAVSSVSIDNCFSATYGHYILMAKCYGSGANNLLVRLRSGGSDATGTDYKRANWTANSTSASSGSSTGESSFVPGFGQLSTVAYGFHLLRMAHPFTANQTGAFLWLGFALQTNIQSAGHYQVHDVAASYDGITAYVASGTFTGTITVYGLRES